MADIEKLKESFRQEASEQLSNVEQFLFDLETKPENTELIRQVYRTAHSLKGSAGMFDFKELESFLHLVEHFLDAALKQIIVFDQNDISKIFKSLDQASLLIKESERAFNDENINLRNELTAFFQSRLKDTDKTEDLGISDDDMPEVKTWEIELTFPENIYEKGPDPAEIFADLDELGKAQYRPDPESLAESADQKDSEKYLTWHITLTATCEEQDIRDVFLFIEDESDITITQKDKPEPEQPQKTSEKSSTDIPAGADGKTSSNQDQDYIKIHSSTLDDLLNLVGELVINQSRLLNLSIDEDVSYQLKNTVEENERLVDSLQSDIVQMRMLPVDTLNLRFRRMVRDMAESMNKEVSYEMYGGETELDKSMLENLVDPIMHLIRNSIDHGIEEPEQRVSAGKPSHGTVSISAYQESGEFVLKVHDDGKGIDPNDVYNKALQKGLIDRDTNLTDEQKTSLIFKPGFSTTEEVTNVSGRGMGMDVVKKAVEGMSGSISINSQPGSYSEYTVRLPLTLAITECLMVQTGKQVFGIPVSYIERVQEYAREKTDFRERPIIKYEDGYIPFVRLHSIFNTGLENTPLEKMVIIRHQGKPMGILTDTIIGNMQAVMKPLPPMFSKVSAISSSTILGDGSVGLILDVPELGALCRKEEQEYLNSIEQNHLNNTNNNTDG